MANIRTAQGKNPLTGTNFLLRIDGVYDLPCSKISGITDQMEFETIQSGGENDYVYLRQKQANEIKSFQIERYIGSDFFDPLPVGAQLHIPVVLYVSRYRGDFQAPSVTFTFTGCTVMSKSFSELDGNRSNLLVETTKIAYQTVSRLYLDAIHEV